MQSPVCATPKSGECVGAESSSLSGVNFSAAFFDNSNMNMDRQCGFIDELGDICAISVDGLPAAPQQSPVMGNGWICHEKNNTDEVMCVNHMLDV